MPNVESQMPEHLHPDKWNIIVYLVDNKCCAVPNKWLYESEGQLFAWWYLGKRSTKSVIEDKTEPNENDTKKWISHLAKITYSNVGSFEKAWKKYQRYVDGDNTSALESTDVEGPTRKRKQESDSRSEDTDGTGNAESGQMEIVEENHEEPASTSKSRICHPDLEGTLQDFEEDFIKRSAVKEAKFRKVLLRKVLLVHNSVKALTELVMTVRDGATASEGSRIIEGFTLPAGNPDVLMRLEKELEDPSTMASLIQYLISKGQLAKRGYEIVERVMSALLTDYCGYFCNVQGQKYKKNSIYSTSKRIGIAKAFPNIKRALTDAFKHLEASTTLKQIAPFDRNVKSLEAGAGRWLTKRPAPKPQEDLPWILGSGRGVRQDNGEGARNGEEEGSVGGGPSKDGSENLDSVGEAGARNVEGLNNDSGAE